MRRAKWALTVVTVVWVISCVSVRVGGEEVAGGGWKDTAVGVAGQVFLGAEGGVVFYALDTLAEPNQTVELTARLQRADLVHDLAGVTVGYYVQEVRAGMAVTDEKGFARLKWTPRREGDYAFTVRVAEVGAGEDRGLMDLAGARLLVACRGREAEFAVVDLDHTVVDSSFFRVLLGGGAAMADSAEVLRRVARQYSLIYLTHRPDVMTQRSKSWLVRNGYPDGPLLASELRGALGSSGEYKTARLTELRRTHPNMRMGIGDKISDALAYVDNGMTAYLIPQYEQKPAAMREMVAQLKGLGGRGRLQVVSGWREIEAGVFQGKEFPAERFAWRLEQEAAQVERQQED